MDLTQRADVMWDLGRIRSGASRFRTSRSADSGVLLFYFPRPLNLTSLDCSVHCQTGQLNFILGDVVKSTKTSHVSSNTREKQNLWLHSPRHGTFPGATGLNTHVNPQERAKRSWESTAKGLVQLSSSRVTAEFSDKLTSSKVRAEAPGGGAAVREKQARNNEIIETLWVA